MIPEKFSEKQLIHMIHKNSPKKVLFVDAGYDVFASENIYACICPSCKAHIIDFCDDDLKDSDYIGGDIERMFKSCLIHHAGEGRNNFCDRCGQKLDWGSYRN